MTKRHAMRLAAALVLLAALAVLLPGSPVFLANFFSANGQHDGHSTRYWMNTLNSSDNEARYHAIFALGTIGAEASDAVPALATIMVHDPDREARHQAAQALMKMAPASRTAVPALAQALKDKEPSERMNAAMALL